MFGFLEMEKGVAVRHQNGTMRYPEFNKLLSLLRSRLEEKGAKPGDRVALILPNSLELLSGYYACLLGGFVAVPINERQTPREVERILRHCSPRVIVARPPRVSESEEEWRSHLESTMPLEIFGLEGIHTWTESEADLSGPALPIWPPNHPAILFYTSGSTGDPKGALYSHRTLIENGRIYREAMGITSSDHSVLCHCLASNFVFSQVTVPFLDLGGTVEVVDFGSAEQTLHALESGATFLSLIPWFGFQLIEEGRERPLENLRLRACAVGGDRIPHSFFSEFKETFGVTPREYLGMTETNVYSVDPPREEDIRIGSAGLAFPDVQIEIRDSSGAVLPPREEGEIWVLTPGAMVGYWEDPVKTQEAMEDGWISTGDVGHVDQDGYLWFSGRRKDIVICDGDNIHPREVELEIAGHPAVARACVLGVPHPTRGEVVGVAVVLEDSDVDFTLEGLARFLAPRISDVKIPRSLLILDHLPETPNGKIDRKALLRAISGETAGCP